MKNIKYGLDYESMNNQLSKLEDMWDGLFNYLNDYSLTISPTDYDKNCIKCKKETIYNELQDILNYMLEKEEKFNEKRK